MSGLKLEKKPLVEVIVELRWALEAFGPSGSDMAVDPHLDLTLGRLYDRVRSEYPSPEPLPVAELPAVMTPYVVRQRFRAAVNDWPLIQLGPGILTVNETEKYDWLPFRDRAERAIQSLFEAHPKTSDLRPTSILLRYIDAIAFDYDQANVFDFLKDKLKLAVAPPASLFTKHTIAAAPSVFTWRASFRSDAPRAVLSLHLSTGKKGAEPAVIVETIIESKGNELPALPQDFRTWADAAHTIVHDWFFDLIEGELYASFKPV